MRSSSSTESGWRPSEYGPSARNVVVSNDSCSTRTVTVPYLTPVASVVSPASAMTCSILRGAGRRRDVPVVGSAPHDRVAHAAAHDERLEARGLEQVDDVLCLMWNLNLVHGAIVARRCVRGPDVAQAAESDKPRQTLDVGHVPAVLDEDPPAVPGGIARLELEHVVAVPPRRSFPPRRPSGSSGNGRRGRRLRACTRSSVCPGRAPRDGPRPCA